MMILSSLFLLLAGLTSQATAPPAPPKPAPTATPDPWAAIRFMAGAWEGETFEIASTGPYEIYSRSRFKRKTAQVLGSPR